MKVTREVLCEALHLPPDTQIEYIDDKHLAYYQGEIHIVVTHPGLREVAEGNAIQMVVPRFSSQPAVRFEGWGQ